MHGDGDTVIPFELGEQLFEQLSAPQKRFVRLSGGDHNDIVPRDRNYWIEVRRFLLDR
jgi:fermentation-respiration switch protein FrsA (DUF1100 family)